MKTILSCVFKLETNRFAPDMSDKSSFTNRIYEIGDEAVRARMKDANFETPGFEEIIDPDPEYEIRSLFALEAQPGGVVTKDVYEFAVNTLLQGIADCKEEAKARGEDPECAPAALLLALHGAMVAEEHEDADGDLLETLRKAVGERCPIFVTLDLHVNLSQKMVRNADALYPCACYPHTDYRENGVRAAKCLMDTLYGRVHPVMSVRSLPMLFPYMPTTHALFRPYEEKIRKNLTIPGVLNFRLAHGFFASDVREGGPAAIAVTDNDPALAERLVAEFTDELYKNRKDLYRSFYKPAEAVEEAKRLLASGVHAPIVLADVADNPGSGATSDSVKLLEALIDSGMEAIYAMIFDPETEAQAEKAGIGAKIRVKLGGKILPGLTGGPLETEAEVLHLSDGRYIQEGPYMHGALQKMGNAALLKIGNTKVVVNSIRLQPSDRAVFHHFGLSPETCPLVGVKSAVHFRASYEPVAGAILEVEAPALGPMDPRALTYENVPKGTYPLGE